MDSPYNVVDPRGGYRKADVQFARSLRDRDDAYIVTGHHREQSPENSARALHSGTENRDHGDVTVHRDGIEDSMLEFGAEEPLECMDHSFGISFSED